MAEKTPEEIKKEEDAARDAAAAKEQKKLDDEQALAAAEDGKEHPDDKIARANAAAERLEKATKGHREVLAQQEKIKVNEVLGGKSEISEKKTAEEKQLEESQKLVPKEMLDLSKPEAE